MIAFKQKLFGLKVGASHNLSKIYLKQIGSTIILRIFSVLISLIYVPVVLGYLDQEKYGIWITLTTVVNWIQLLDVGMGNGMRNKLAETIAQNKPELGRMYISTTYGILGGIFLGVLVFFFSVNSYINWQEILNTTLIGPVELFALTSITVSFIILRFIVQTIILVYAAHGNTAISAFIQVIINGIVLLLIYLVTLLTEKGNIVILAWIVTGVPVLMYVLLSFYTFIFKYPHLAPAYRLINVKASGNLLRLSAQFFVVQITATIIYASIPFVVAQLFSPNEVTVFNITNSIFNLPIMLIGLITAPVLPLVTQAFAKNDIVWLRSMLKKQIMVAAVIALGTIVMILISPFIYRVWIGDKVEIPFNLSVAIGIYTVIQVLNTPFSIFLNGLGKIRILVILAPLGIVMFIVLSVILAKLMGTVISISIALSITSIVGLIIIPFTLQKHLYI